MNDDISCSNCRQYLPWLISGRLDEDTHLLVQRHLATCARCQADAAQWREVASAVRAAGTAATPHLWENIKAHLATSSSPMPQAMKGMTTLEFDDTALDSAPVAAMSPIKARKPWTAPRRAYPVAAVLLLAMVVIFVFFVRPGQPQLGSYQGTEGFTTAACPDPVPMHLPQGAFLVNLQMLSPSEGWLIGLFHDPASPKDGQPDPLLMHFHQCQWTQVKVSSLHGFYLGGLDMLSPDEGWVIADYTPSGPSARERSVILHYHDGQWQKETIPADIHADTGNNYSQIVMTSPEDGWILAGAIPGDPYVLREQHGVWSVDTTQFAATVSSLSGVVLQGNTVWGYGSSDARKPFIVRYVQGKWRNESLPAAVLAHQGEIVQMSVISAKDIWVAGNMEFYSPFALHYDGTSWSQVHLPGGITNPYPKGIVMVSAQEGWMIVQSVGDHNESTQTLHYQHGVWRRGPALPTPTSPGDMIVVDNTQAFDGDVWGLGSVAVNTQGTPLSAMSDETATVIVHLHNGRWDYYNPYPHR
jgi:hypothetical protein